MRSGRTVVEAWLAAAASARPSGRLTLADPVGLTGRDRRR